MKTLMALDQGTTSSRAVIYDLGQPLAISSQEFTQHYPKPGLVEHNPEEIWESQLAVARSVLKKAGLEASQVGAIGITNQRETTLLWDKKTGTPVHRAIVWQDRRTTPLCDELRKRGLEATIRDKTGLIIDPYFSGTKLAWLLTHVPGVRERAERGELAFGTVDSWLLWRLTDGAVHATDVTNASRTMLYNIHTLAWDDELLDALAIPPSLMPEVKPSAALYGHSDKGLLGAAIPIAGVAGDQHAALFGQACFKPGMAKNTYGTGSFVVMNTGTEAVVGDGVLTTLAWQLEGNKPQYALEASLFITGAAVQWLRDGLGIIRTSAEVEDLAATALDNGGVYFVPALTGLGAPHWDAYARGTIVGLTRGSSKGHIARATLESMAYGTRDGIEAMQRASGIALKELRVDGGASVNNLLMQFQADILATPVLRPNVTETTSLGAAYLAGIGAEMLTLDEIQERWTLDRRFTPSMNASQREGLYRSWQRAVGRSLAWAQGETP